MISLSQNNENNAIAATVLGTVVMASLDVVSKVLFGETVDQFIVIGGIIILFSMYLIFKTEKGNY